MDKRTIEAEPDNSRGATVSCPDIQLGASYHKDRTEFRVFAPTAQGVMVVVADEPAGPHGLVEHHCAPIGHGIHEAIVAGDLEGKYYAYKLRGHGFHPKREIVDIYAVCAQNRYSRSLIVDLAGTDPPGFREHRFERRGGLVEAVIYELHVRDFTIAACSGVRHRGKYLGLAQQGTHLVGNPSVATGLSHLVELGVTHVQLLPVQDFDNDETSDAKYDWGYMPVCLNSPDGWYATQVPGPTRITELKAAIQALHEAGIGVVLDGVYNHTSPRAGFEQLAPGYYFRKDRRGRFCNGSGCGNEFASERPMARKFIIDSVRFWVNEYRVDGFRFDVMALIDIETMKLVRRELDGIDPGILLYGEPWTAGKTPLKNTCDKLRTAGTGIGAFNDGFRDAIKGDRNGGPPGFIQTGSRADGVRAGLASVGEDWPTSPGDAVNYFECHDNLTAWDKLRQTSPHAPVAIRERMSRLAALILLASQGAVFLHAGQEFGRTKRGHCNTYNLPDAINRIDWSLKRRRAGLYAYYRHLIALRKDHPAFRLTERPQVEARISFPRSPSERCIVYRINGRRLRGEAARWLLVLLNGEPVEMTFPLPRGRWSIHADAERASTAPLGHVEGRVTLPGHTGMLLMR